jgi:hypothetical protein
MRKLDVSAISISNAMPFKAGTFEHIQFAYQEAIAELGKALFNGNYDPTKVYILSGVINSGSGSNYDVSAGAVFYNGEIFLVDAVAFTISGSNVAVGTITTTFYANGVRADGVDFTDGITRNIHQIRKMVYGPALAGSGDGDFEDLVNLAYRPVGGIGQTVEWLMPGSGSQNSLLATYFDATSLEGIHPLTLGWKIDDGGYFTAAYKAGDTNFGTIGQTGGALDHLIIASEVPKPAGLVPGLDGPRQKPADGGGDPIYYVTGPISGATAATTPLSLIPKNKTKLKITRYY